MDRFKLMETYALVAKHGSYTRAAQELGVTRALISKRIQDLEAALDTKLLNRNTHNLSLTSIGKEYYENCLVVLSQVRDIEDRVQSKRGVPRGEVRILTSRTFGETVLGRIAAEFSRAYPRIAVHITLADRETATHGMDLVSGGFDIAVRTLPVRDKSLVARAITGLPRVLVATPEYIERHGLPRHPHDLTHHNCLDPSGATHYNWNFRGASGETAVRVSGSPCANSSLVIRNATLEGLGIAIMREYLVIDDISAGTLMRVLPSYAIDERTLYIVHHRDRRQPMRIKIFADYLAKRVDEFLKDTTKAPGLRRR